MKVGFKIRPKSTGLASIGEARLVDIKLDGRVCGWIQGPSWRSQDSLWRVYLRVMEDGQMKNRIALKKHETEEAARLWVRNNLPQIAKNHKLWFE